jgi:hypothetical protein
LLAAFLAAIVVAFILTWHDDEDSEQVKSRTFSPDQPTIVWVMLGVGVITGLTARLAIRHERQRGAM